MEEQKPSWTFNAGDTDTVPADVADTDETISWTASEYIEHDKNNLWYVSLISAGTLIALAVYFVTDETLPSATIIIAAILLAVIAARKPAARQYSLSRSTLIIDQTTHRLSDFRSFSIIEEGAIDGIWLKPLARFKPMVVMYFAPDDEEKIINVLSNSLPHEQRELDPFERVSRRLRF